MGVVTFSTNPKSCLLSLIKYFLYFLPLVGTLMNNCASYTHKNVPFKENSLYILYYVLYEQLNQICSTLNEILKLHWPAPGHSSSPNLNFSCIVHHFITYNRPSGGWGWRMWDWSTNWTTTEDSVCLCKRKNYLLITL